MSPLECSRDIPVYHFIILIVVDVFRSPGEMVGALHEEAHRNIAYRRIATQYNPPVSALTFQALCQSPPELHSLEKLIQFRPRPGFQITVNVKGYDNLVDK